MRATYHSGKGSARHNDHHETKKNDGHIDYTKTSQNRVWTRMDNRKKGLKYSAEEGERVFYDRYFSKTLDKQNAKYKAKGQYGYMRDMEQWMKASQHSPSETMLQIGDRKNHVTGDELWKATVDFVNWKQERYKGNYVIISVVEHVDESTPHVHMRELWYWHDEDGLLQPGIKKGLKEAGVPLPDPSKPEGKDNYRKAVVDAECRAKWHEILLSYGFDIETEPDETRTLGHMGVDAWKAYSEAMERVDARETALNARESVLQEKSKDLDVKSSELDLKAEKLAEKEKTLTKRERVVRGEEMSERTVSGSISKKQRRFSSFIDSQLGL